MSQTIQEFLARLKDAITSFYAASYSLDTDIHAVLSAYAGEFVSGSRQIETTYDNLFIFTATAEKLLDNFGTYFYQPQYFVQDLETDLYVTNSGSIPAYQKTIDFLLDAALHGSTTHALARVTHAYTLVTPDIRELYQYDRWKLKTVTGSINATVEDTLTISPDPGWKRNELYGSLALLVSGSGSSPVQDGGKFVVPYLVSGNTQNTITLLSIDDLTRYFATAY